MRLHSIPIAIGSHQLFMYCVYAFLFQNTIQAGKDQPPIQVKWQLHATVQCIASVKIKHSLVCRCFSFDNKEEGTNHGQEITILGPVHSFNY